MMRGKMRKCRKKDIKWRWTKKDEQAKSNLNEDNNGKLKILNVSIWIIPSKNHFINLISTELHMNYEGK
jgi:hypothetical protein